MKTTNLLLIAMAGLFLMTACSDDPKAKARKNVEADIIPKLKDPGSYSFISMELNPALTRADSIKAEAVVYAHKALVDNELAQDTTQRTPESEIESKYNAYAKAITPEMDKQVIAYLAEIKYKAVNGLGLSAPADGSYFLDANYQTVAGPRLDNLVRAKDKWKAEYKDLAKEPAGF
ncbi:MAG: hypothetical protein JST83_01325 [Bacteroidetes bacterium]|nr:hypothetical protein [Bacteroidota bacterium]